MNKDNISIIRDAIEKCSSDLVFTYNGLPSGVTSKVSRSIPTFQAWHGDDYKYYASVDEVMLDKFYSGRSLTEIADEIDYWFL